MVEEQVVEKQHPAVGKEVEEAVAMLEVTVHKSDYSYLLKFNKMNLL